jgi:glycosyltransferase involved in cell wall biosynthesis
MKIVILSFYSGLQSRGVESFVKNFSSHLSSTHRITVYQAGKALKNQKYKQLVLPTSFSFETKIKKWQRKFYLDYYSRKILFFTLKILPFLWKEKPDIIMPTNNGWQSLICKIYSLFFKLPLVLAGHAGPGADDYLNLKLCPDIFICFSQTQAKWASKINKNVHIKVISHGVDLKRFNKSVLATKVFLPSPIILCVAALDEYKRVELTIKAVASLSKGSLLLISQGSRLERNRIELLGEKYLGKRFKQLTISSSELPHFYKTAQLFTLVSTHREAFGIVYLEAMACGLPVVATDDSLRREIVGTAGLFVKNPENIKEYALVLEKALKISWGEKPRKQAEKFSWDKIASKYNQLFQSLRK